MINFPTSPTVGQQFSASGRSWTWDGEAWISNVPPIGVGPQGEIGVRGPAGFRGDQGPQGFHGGPLPVQNGNRNRFLRAPSTTTLEWSNNVAGYIFNDPIISATGPRLRELDNTRFSFQINLSQGGVQKLRIINPTANFVLPAPSTGKRLRIVIEQTNLGNHTVNWSNVLWPDGVAPSLNAETPVSTFDFLSDGQNWYGSKLRALPKRPLMQFTSSTSFTSELITATNITNMNVPVNNYSGGNFVAVAMEYSSAANLSSDILPAGWTRGGVFPDPLEGGNQCLAISYKILEQSDSGIVFNSIGGGIQRKMLLVFRNINGRIENVEIQGLKNVFATGVQTINAPPDSTQKSCIAIHYASNNNSIYYQDSNSYWGNRVSFTPTTAVIRRTGQDYTQSWNYYWLWNGQPANRYASQIRIFNPGDTAQNVTAGATLSGLPAQSLFWLVIT